MPFQNEHSARINNPDKYIRIRRENNWRSTGIDMIWGILKRDGKETTEMQALRFPVERWTVAEAKRWLKAHPDIKVISFEPATIQGGENAMTNKLAEWTIRFINDLPDSSFAFIKAGGEKDEEGKTKPRGLMRFLPFKDGTGKVDLSHLKYALARLPQTKLTLEEKAKARKVLEAAAKIAKIGRFKGSEQVVHVFVPMEAIKLQEKDGKIISEIQIMKLGSVEHPIVGFFDITSDSLLRFKSNFDNDVRGIELSVDYHHKNEDGAAAWFRKVFLNENGSELWAEVEWTPEGKSLVTNKVFKYFSPEFRFEYKDMETGLKHFDVLLGGALTNRPVLKGMAPIQLSETLTFFEEKGEEKMVKVIREGKILEINENEKVDTDKEATEEAIKELEAANKGGDGGDGGDKGKDKGVKAEETAKLSERIVDLEEKAVKLQEKVDTQEKLISLKERTDKFTKLLSEGRVVPAQKEAFLKSNMEEFISKGGKIVKLAESGKPVDPNSITLSEEEVVICDKLGLTKEEYIKYGK